MQVSGALIARPGYKILVGFVPLPFQEKRRPEVMKEFLLINTPAEYYKLYVQSLGVGRLRLADLGSGELRLLRCRVGSRMLSEFYSDLSKL